MYVFKEIKTNKEGVEKLAQDMFSEYKYCFCRYSSKKWVNIFAKARFERIRDEQEERVNNKLSKSFEDKVIKRFGELIMNYIDECKKKFEEEEKKKNKKKK